MTTIGTKTDGHWDLPLDAQGVHVVAYPVDRSEETGEFYPPYTLSDGREIIRPKYRRLPPLFEPFPPKRMCVRVVDMERGRSAARLTLEDIDTGRRYPMFLVDVMEMMSNLVFEGEWRSVKRGANYGIHAQDGTTAGILKS